jgi:membrane protease YdiL (CAAX protease family)
MNTTTPTSVGEDHTRRQARRGLALYLIVVVLLTAVFDILLIVTLDPVWGMGRMFAPAVASVVARLVLREGFADVSFRFGGRRTWKYVGLALVFPIAIGLIVYSIAWTTGLARFDPQPSGGLSAQLSGIASSPVLVFVIMLAVSTFLLVFPNSLFAAGEEIGWRGYMLTRLIDAGVPRPILASGLVWGLWHMPLVLAGLYAAGSSPVLSAVLLMITATSFGYVLARMRLETGSIWPAIILHGAWNSIIQTAFDPATAPEAKLWVGESGILTALALVAAAVIFSRGRWTIRKVPEAREVAGIARPAPRT